MKFLSIVENFINSRMISGTLRAGSGVGWAIRRGLLGLGVALGKVFGHSWCLGTFESEASWSVNDLGGLLIGGSLLGCYEMK